jgi:outer membrane protein
MFAGAVAIGLASAVLIGAPGAAQGVSAAHATPPPTPTPAPSQLPYPAYGTPAPDVAQSRPVAGVPTSVSLVQAMAIAVAQSPAFATQRAQYDITRAKYASEKLAIFPSVSANADATRSYGSSSTRNGSGGNGNGNTTSGSGPFTTLSATAQLQQLIFDGGRVIAAIKSAKQADLAGQQTLERQLQALEFNVAKAYYGVLQANAAVDASAQSVHLFEITENSIAAKIHAGAAARSDLSLATFQTSRARGLLVSAQGLAIAAQSAFALTLGLDADTAIAPQGSGQSAIAATPTYQKSLAQALLLRPDYLAAQHTVDAASDNLRYAKLARFPVLNGTASDGVNRTLPSSTSFSHSASLGATLSIPIFDQGLTTFNVASAQSQLDQANAGLTLAKLTVESDVRTALSGLISARALLVQAQLELQSAQVGLSAAQARYKVGVATILDLVTAEANYAQAQTDYVNAVYGAQIAEQTFNFALGLTDLKGISP